MFRSVPATLTVAALLVAGAACRKQAPPGPNVWAVVNGKQILRDEVEKHYRRQLVEDRSEPSHEEALTLKLSILEQLINNEILLERAKKLGVEATDGEVEDKFTEMKSPFTEEEFQQQLKQREMTVDDLKGELRRELSMQKVLNREVAAKVTITDQEITDYYNQNRAQFNVVEPLHRIAQIVVTPRQEPLLRNRMGDDARTDAEARKKIQSLLERLQSSADFAQLAMDYSEDPSSAPNGGDLGYLPESALNQSDPQTKRIVLGLRPGATSGIIVAGGAYRILKLLAREAPGQRELDAVRQTIRDTLRNRKEQLLRAAFITVARNEAQVANYLARQVLESAGKLPQPLAKPAGQADRPVVPAKQ